MKVGLIGHPVAHSVSPRMHAGAFAAAGLLGQYSALDVAPGAVAEFLARARREGWRGFNVTIPHKETVYALCDRLDPLARRVGAVNTVVLEPDGVAVGHNTDVGGFLEPLQAACGDEVFQRALIVGAGGAARAAAIALQSSGVSRVVVCNRSPERAEALANALGIEAVPLERDALAGVAPDLVVNATPLGMKRAEGSPQWRSAVVAFERLPWSVWSDPLAYDLIYAPRMTPFLSVAARFGCSTLGGLGMLVGQGALAFELWTGVAASRVRGPMAAALV